MNRRPRKPQIQSDDIPDGQIKNILKAYADKARKGKRASAYAYGRYSNALSDPTGTVAIYFSMESDAITVMTPVHIGRERVGWDPYTADLAKYLEEHRGPCVSWRVQIWDNGETYKEERTENPVVGLLPDIVRADMGWLRKTDKQAEDKVRIIAGSPHVYEEYSWERRAMNEA